MSTLSSSSHVVAQQQTQPHLFENIYFLNARHEPGTFRDTNRGLQLVAGQHPYLKRHRHNQSVHSRPET